MSSSADRAQGPTHLATAGHRRSGLRGLVTGRVQLSTWSRALRAAQLPARNPRNPSSEEVPEPSEIAVRGQTGGCIGFGPDTEIWRSIPPVTGAEAPAIAVATDLGLTMLVQKESEDSLVAVEVLTGEGWKQQATRIPVASLDTVTATAAGDWLVIFASDQPPTLVHLPSGVWHVDSDGPLDGLDAPNAVWSGDQLVVWGAYQTIRQPKPAQYGHRPPRSAPACYPSTPNPLSEALTRQNAYAATSSAVQGARVLWVTLAPPTHRFPRSEGLGRATGARVLTVCQPPPGFWL